MARPYPALRGVRPPTITRIRRRLHSPDGPQPVGDRLGDEAGVLRRLFGAIAIAWTRALPLRGGCSSPSEAVTTSTRPLQGSTRSASESRDAFGGRWGGLPSFTAGSRTGTGTDATVAL
jgi:hypothetical protein